MKTLLRPYEGTLPYLFVSYAHKDDAAVLDSFVYQVMVTPEFDYQLDRHCSKTAAR